MSGLVHRNNALQEKILASNILMGTGNDKTDTVEKRIEDLENGGGGGGSTVEVTPLLDDGVHIADIEVDGVKSELYAPEGGGTGNVNDVTINGQSIVDDHVADIPVMSGATQQANGSVGLVPAPSVNDRNKVLMGDGTWGSGGLVDDVLVDGISVVNNKVANIDLTGKQDVLTVGNNVKIENDVISVPEMVGATSMESGKSGVVPQPLTSDKDKFLRGDGTWDSVGNVDDVVMNGQSIVDANKIANFNNYVELTRAEWEALPDSKYSDGILYCIKDSGSEKTEFFYPIIYSLAEREVGVWTDGKPLYQKTVFFQSGITLTQYSWTDIYDASQVNIEKFVDFTPYTFNQVCPFGLYLSELNSSNHIRIVCLQNWAINGFTFRYTKTTDNPGTGKWTTSGVPAHHYSTEEQVIGTWIDGKPLYEKSYYVNSPVGQSNGYIQDSTLANVQCVIKSSGKYQRNVYSSGTVLYTVFDSLDSYENTSLNGFLRVVKISPNTSEIGIVYRINGTDSSALSNLCVTIQYTKTTD